MNAGDLGIRNLATAQQLLLAPYELDEAKLQRVLADIFTHKVDYADLYFQHTRNEAWSLEEGIVKSGSFSIDQGVGVRAVSGDKTAFAYSDDISLPALSQAAAATRTIGKSGSGRVKVASALASRDRAQPLYAERSAGLDDRHREGGAAGAHREDGARQGPARGAGHGRAGR